MAFPKTDELGEMPVQTQDKAQRADEMAMESADQIKTGGGGGERDGKPMIERSCQPSDQSL